MRVQWYPGQMAKATRLLAENSKLVDAVIEVLDARIPASSRNPAIRQILEIKPLLAVLTHADLADPGMTKKWLQVLQKDYFAAVALNVKSGRGVKKLLLYLRKIPRKKSKSKRPLRIMVAGIPNVGKSSLINRLIGRKAAIIGNKPGVTRGKQWLKLADNLEILDTPGVLWPKIESEKQAFALAAMGAVKDELLDMEELAGELSAYLQEKFVESIRLRYGFDPSGMNRAEVLKNIAVRSGCLRRGGEADVALAARLFVKDFREGRLGRLTLDEPGEGEDESIC